MKKTKVFTSITAVILAAVLLFVTIVTINNNTKVANAETAEASVRTVELSQDTIDAQSILDEFDNATLTTEGTTTYFEGFKPLDKSTLSEIDYISDIDFEELDECIVKYNFSYDTESNIVTIAAQATLSDGTVEIDEISGVGFINDGNEIDAVMNIDGEGVLLSEMRDAGLIENCGWFSKLIKTVVTVAVAAVVLAATATVIVATAGVATPALVAVGVGASTASAIGATAGLATGAIFVTTVGTAAIQAGVSAGEDIGDGAENVVNSLYNGIHNLVASVVSALATPSLNKKCYYFAYLYCGELKIETSYSMNYLQAYAVLLKSELINVASIPSDIYSKIINLSLSSSLNTLIGNLKNNSQISSGKFGIYTYDEQDAANLAYAAGAFLNNIYQSEIHDNRTNSGYYYHFHDVFHVIHIWYGNAS